MVVWEENQTSAVLAQMPYLSGMSQTYGAATSYHGLTHPSLGNYLVAASGQGVATCGLVNPLPAACPQSGSTVFGQALAAGRTAKTYAESMTTNCQQTNSTLYAVRHNPWAYFTDEAADCQRLDVPLGTLSSGALRDDVEAGALPDVSMVVPDLQDDLHDGTAAQADAWLHQWLPAVMAGADYQAGRLAIVVTFDEGLGTDQVVPFVVISPGATGRTVTADFDHYGLCHLSSDVLGLAPLAGCAVAPGLGAAFGL
jgi:acid phosphatase